MIPDEEQKTSPPQEPREAAEGGEPAAAEEAGAPGEAGAPQAESVEELQLLLEDARNKADENREALLRARAEVDNLRKRNERDVENAHKFGTEKIVAELLPVWDSMELGLAAASEEGVDIAKVREGMELTLKMLVTAMEKSGVAQVDPAGQPFDPELHQAMTMRESDQVPPGSVVDVVQKGYTLNGRLVRPALVVVAQAPEASA